jgi:hypothetical protein
MVGWFRVGSDGTLPYQSKQHHFEVVSLIVDLRISCKEYDVYAARKVGYLTTFCGSDRALQS